MMLSTSPQIEEGLLFLVCRGPTCGAKGENLGRILAKYLKDNGHAEIAVQNWQSCFGRCTQGPNIVVERLRGGRLQEEAKAAVMLGGTHPDYQFEHGVTEADLPALVERHIAMFNAQRAL